MTGRTPPPGPDATAAGGRAEAAPPGGREVSGRVSLSPSLPSPLPDMAGGGGRWRAALSPGAARPRGCREIEPGLAKKKKNPVKPSPRVFPQEGKI